MAQVWSMSAPWRLNCVEITVSTEVLALLHVNIPRNQRSQVLVIIDYRGDIYGRWQDLDEVHYKVPRKCHGRWSMM